MRERTMGHAVGRLALAGLVVFIAGAALAGDDDLAVVRKAVQVAQNTKAAPAAETQRAKPKRPDEGRAETAWLRIRIAEKGRQRERVSINVPLSFVEALADEDADRPAKGRGRHCGLDWAAVVKALRSTSSIVDIEDDEASVRVYVE
jgi:hypothetical protein